MKNLVKKFTSPGNHDASCSLGLLILRIASGGMMLVAHGWGKLLAFSEKSGGFPDPLGIGSETSTAMAIFAEVVCALAIILGLFTRVAAMPLVVTMLVAALIVHGDDPFQKKEFALVYALPFLTLIFTGAGKYSIDGAINR